MRKYLLYAGILCSSGAAAHPLCKYCPSSVLASWHLQGKMTITAACDHLSECTSACTDDLSERSCLSEVSEGSVDDLPECSCLGEVSEGNLDKGQRQHSSICPTEADPPAPAQKATPEKIEHIQETVMENAASASGALSHQPSVPPPWRQQRPAPPWRQRGPLPSWRQQGPGPSPGCWSQLNGTSSLAAISAIASATGPSRQSKSARRHKRKKQVAKALITGTYRPTGPTPPTTGAARLRRQQKTRALAKNKAAQAVHAAEAFECSSAPEV